jgi:hypothetical protein
MNELKFQELVDRFGLKNDLTDNFNIWVGHAKIGFRDAPKIEEAKKILLEFFEEFVEEYEPTPEHIKNLMKQWENYHPYQNIRELDQPMFISKGKESVTIAVIWPWQLKDGIASLMVYQGRLI